ncbi:hypothetical protein SAMN05216207_10917 [Pseudonocardia ammonioxydans]|uniref:Uncharacterized protein n=1 Tax=Pseudonocardia ammonioxydans TaxID=260086 RepID=A0A1I5I8A7_PSUAM|nr:hypothetical protein [Pseudonocardia ammonioxydans]SFO56844.1 hypothetical protein SAMN05216207_10917 [Pseudonocardia ammonioxydans]
MRSFTDADALSKVLHWRLGQLLEKREPERGADTGVAEADWTTVADTLAPGAVRDYLHALGTVALERQHTLGTEIANQPPQWALDRLPEVPDPTEAAQDRADWERRAGLVAAYREYRGIPDHEASLGQAPPTEQPFAYNLWRQATEALDPDPTALAWQQKDTTELYRAREAWALELYRADEYGPRAVGEDLAATRRLAAEIRDDSLLTRAEADAPEPAGDRAELLATAQRHQELAATYTDQADVLAREYEARQQWWEQTAPLREADQAAAVELERRNLPTWRETTLPDEARGEQLELPDTTTPAGAGTVHDTVTPPIGDEPSSAQDEPTATAQTSDGAEVAADTSDRHPTNRAREAVEALRQTAHGSELKRARTAPARARDQHQRSVHDAYTQRARKDQLDIEAERTILGQQHAQPARGLDHGYDVDYGHDDYGYDIDDDY